MLKIPAGRVSQRVQAIQDASKAFPASSGAISPKTPQRTSIDLIFPPPSFTETTPKHLGTRPSPEKDKQQNQKAESSIRHEETEGRGRKPQRCISLLQSEELNEVDEVLEDVRARLHSVQNIIREQSGSSHGRDEMMDELGSMLDDAIATTMVPFHGPHMPTRCSSSRRPSPKKQVTAPSPLSRSQSTKTAGTRLPMVESMPKNPLRSPPKELPRVSERVQDASESIKLLENHFETGRKRQVSEPAAFITRRTGFPLSSPVRERALL